MKGIAKDKVIDIEIVTFPLPRVGDYVYYKTKIYKVEQYQNINFKPKYNLVRHDESIWIEGENLKLNVFLIKKPTGYINC